MFAYSPEMQTINFTDPNGLYTLIIGKNGRGKSSITKILNIALYFSCDGIPMGEFANEINGDGYVEISVDSYGSSWTIISEYSNVKLKSLQVFKDGQLQDWGGIKTTKEKVAQNIVDIPQKLFNNIINLSVNDFKSFLSLSSKDSKEIRDKIFSFGILNQMAQMENQKLLQSKKEIERIQTVMDSLTSSLSSTHEEYRKSTEDFVIRKNEAERLYLEYKELWEPKVQDLEIKKNDLSLKVETLRTSEREQTTSHVINTTIDIESELVILSESLKKEQENIKESISLKEKTENKLKIFNSLLEDKKYTENISKIESLYEKLKNEELLLSSLREEAQALENKRGENLKILEERNKEISSLTTKISSLISRLKHLESKLSIHSSLLKIKFTFDTDLALDTYIESREKSIKHLRDEITSLKNEEILLLGENEKIKSRLELIKDGKDSCPTCGNPVDSKHLGEELETTFENNKKTLSNIKGSLLDLEDKLKSAEKSLIKVQEVKSKKEMMISYYEADPVDSLSLEDFLSFPLEEEITKVKSEILTLEEVLVKLKSENDLSENNLDSEISIKNKEIENQRAKVEVSTLALENLSKSNIPPKEENFFLDDPTGIFEKYKVFSISEIEDEIGKISSEIANLTSSTSLLENKKISLESKISSLTSTRDKNLELLSSTFKDFKLPTSHVSIDTSLKDKINLFLKDIENIELELSQIKTKENSLLSSIKSIEIESKTKEDYIKSVIERTEKELENFKKETQVILHENHVQEAFLRTLSDDGVKSYVMSKIVPYLNQEINSFISRFNINVTVEFDSEFVGTLRRNGHSPSLQSISTGQRKIIDVCILLSITKFFIKKYPDINLVFYDEIFSSLDTENSPTILKLIKQEFCENLGITVCLVSHQFVNPALIDRFISVEDKNYFSNLNILSREQYLRQYQ